MERVDGRKKQMEENGELELYIHIPFCVRKCVYCDFPSAPADEDTRDRYLEALLAEIRIRAEAYRQYTVSSVFIGGGTPSLLKGGQIARLMDGVREHYRLAEGAESTLEVNPGTADQGKLAAYWQAGINRLSIGLQSADNGELALLGRIHTYEDFLDTYRTARMAGFHNLNVDVMAALPGQSLEGYCATLRKVMALEPEHISAYSLILEEGTPLLEMVDRGLVQSVDEDMDRCMYQETKRLLKEAGYHRYEISNYAREGYACKHNLGYWQRKNYLGLGLSAASLVENVRFRNGSNLSAYLEDPSGCREACQILTRQEQMEEFFFLGLRMTDGVDLGSFERIFGCRPETVYGEVIRKNVQDGLLKYSVPDSGRNGAGTGGKAYGNLIRGAQEPDRNREGKAEERIALTERGLDLSNYVSAQFLLT